MTSPRKLFHFKRAGTQKFMEIPYTDDSQHVCDAIDAFFLQLGKAAIIWKFTTLVMEIGENPSNRRWDPLPIHQPCSHAFEKWLRAVGDDNEQIHHCPPALKQEFPSRSVSTTSHGATPHLAETTTAATSYSPVGKEEKVFESTSAPSLPPLLSPPLPSEQSGAMVNGSSTSYHHHHHVDSSNMSNITMSDQSIFNRGDVTHSALRSGGVDVAASTPSSADLTAPTLARTWSIAPKPSSTRDAYVCSPVANISHDIQQALDRHPEVFVHSYDSTLDASDFVNTLMQRMSSIVRLTIAYFDSSREDKVVDEELNGITADVIKSWKKRGTATGFIVGEQLLMTNWHVFPSAVFAGFPGACVEFDYDSQVASSAVKGSVRPEVFYWSDRRLDCCVVAFSIDPTVTTSKVRHPIILSSVSPLDQQRDDDDRLAIIHHPAGKLKRLSLDGCSVKGVDKHFGYLLYSLDTERGSSGSPVFNRRWELVAIHHCSIDGAKYQSLQPRTKKQKRGAEQPLRINQGTLASAVYHALVQHLVELTTSPVPPRQQIGLLREMLLRDPEAPWAVRARIEEASESAERPVAVPSTSTIFQS